MKLMDAPTGLSPVVHDAIMRAIAERRVLRLTSRGKERNLEPHDYGRHNGAVKLLGYQLGGASSGRLPNWRWILAHSISAIEVLDRRFSGGRGAGSAVHHVWEELFARVGPAD